MDGEVALALTQISQARTPEQIFGELKGTKGQQKIALGHIYRKLLKKVHPDKVTNPVQREEAEMATRIINDMRQSAIVRIDAGAYGSSSPNVATTLPPKVVIVSSRKRNYAVGELVENGQLCNTYACTFSQDDSNKTGLIKVSRLPGDNDLVKREAEVLQHLASDTEHESLHIYVPKLVETFRYRESGSAVIRQANVLALPSVASNPLEWFSLEEVRAAYPKGVTTADMAWMWRRLLVVLGFAHRCGVVHGAVLPANIYIHPEAHGLMLTNWSHAVRDPVTSGERISAISAQYESWYPQEVWDKSLPRLGLDLFLGARSMMYLLGSDPIDGKFPDSVARKYVAHLRGTALKNPSLRPQDAWQLLEEFDELLGKRIFRPFSMPEKSSGRAAN